MIEELYDPVRRVTPQTFMISEVGRSVADLIRLSAVPLTRRSLLAAVGAVLVMTPAGCTMFDGEPETSRASAPPPPPDPLFPLLAAEAAVLALYDGVAARHPQLARRLQPLRGNHVAHLNALREIVRVPAATPSAPASPTPTPVAAPATAAAALGALRAAESAAARRVSIACLTAPVERAALLGSIAACESAHLVLLR